MHRCLDRFDVKPGKLYQPIRVAITGSTVSPGIFESLALLGREQTLVRLDAAIERLGSEMAAFERQIMGGTAKPMVRSCR